MTDEQLLKQFVNDVYLTKFNRFIDGVDASVPGTPTDADALVEMQKVCRWASMWASEIELERDYEGRLMDWRFLRTNDVDLGTILTTTTPITVPSTYKRLVVRANRPLTIMQDVSRVSTWKVVDPNQQTKRSDTWTGPRVSQLGTKVLFSRAFTTGEIGGHVFADCIAPLDRMSYVPGVSINVQMLKLLDYELVVLGVAKNATLPGIVEGGLSTPLAQKYNDLLDGAKAASMNTSIADDAWDEEDFGYIGGIM